MSAYKTLYVPDPQKWTNFYLQIHRVSPYADHTMKGYQRGGGLRNKTSPFMLSIDKHAIDSNDKNIKLNVTSPAEQVVDQAKSEVRRETIIKNAKTTPKRRIQESPTAKNGPKLKKTKVVKLKSDVFGLH